MSSQPQGMPLGVGKGESARRHVEGGTRGLFEDYLRIIRGRLDTTTPTILQGTGWSVVKNGTGDVTITFEYTFTTAPIVIATIDRVVGATGLATHQPIAPTTTTAQIVRFDTAFNVQDGTLSFLAIGPI